MFDSYFRPDINVWERDIPPGHHAGTVPWHPGSSLPSPGYTTVITAAADVIHALTADDEVPATKPWAQGED